jgi:hypothetical protein
MDHCLPSAWNVSWNGLLAYLSAAGAVSAIDRAISAASACAARSRASCKRQVGGSIPLTGSQVRPDLRPLVSLFVERTSAAGLSGVPPAVVTDGGGRVDEAPRGNSLWRGVFMAAVQDSDVKLILLWTLCECVDFRTEQDVEIFSHQAM